MRNPGNHWFDMPFKGGAMRFSSHLEGMFKPEEHGVSVPTGYVVNVSGSQPYQTALCVALFDPTNPALHARSVQSGGRQSAWFIDGPMGSALLRHYRRGGLMAKFSKAHYLWQGARRTRAFAEFSLLDAMFRQGLPVPRPLAAAYWKHGFTYRAAIIVARIPDVAPLADCLDAADPVAVAAAVLKIHDAGVWHADLNAFNILLNAGGHVWVIDFDRGESRQMSRALRQANLQRLRRSMVKVAAEQGERFWQSVNVAYWQLASA